MKAKAFLAFALLMLFSAICGAITLPVAYIAVFLAGALLSDLHRSLVCSNVAGFLGKANGADTTNDDVGEWQQFVLHRNGKGMNTGSTLFGLMSRLANEDADSQIYNWWEKDPVPRTFTTDAHNAGSAGDALTLVLAPTDYWVFLKAGAIIENQRTLERIRIVTTPTSNSVVTVRGALGYTGSATAAPAILTTDTWVLVTSARPNGAIPTKSAYTQPSPYTNYIQTFNATASIDNAYKAGILRTDLDGPKMEAQLDALEQIANDIELAYFMGVKDLQTVTDSGAGASSGPAYYTGGIRNAIDTASLTANALNGNGSAGVTLDAFTDWIRSFMTQGSDTKLGFFGPTAYAAISKYANANSGGYRTMDHSETAFGLNIETIKTPHGELSLASHPLFKNIPILNDYGFVVDLQLIVQKTMEPLFFQEFEPVNGQDSWQGQFRAKLGLKQKFPAAFGYCYALDKITP